MTCLLLAAALEIINCLKQLRAILFYVCSPYLALVSAQQCFLKTSVDCGPMPVNSSFTGCGAVISSY